ncbi:MAG: hypothetical protein NT007_00535 [Candidatus Kapabacteria bacterium]|nr:hypothetical protein [Candidatus Kapabacteria bacterium]
MLTPQELELLYLSALQSRQICTDEEFLTVRSQLTEISNSSDFYLGIIIGLNLCEGIFDITTESHSLTYQLPLHKHRIICSEIYIQKIKEESKTEALAILN